MSTTVNPNPNSFLKDAATIRDFDNDGQTDIFWRNTQTGENGIWLMSGTKPDYYTKAEFLQTVPLAWNYTIGDFNADGKTDLFWRNSETGENAIWLMNGTTYTDAVVLSTTIGGVTTPATLPKEWKPSIADVDGDGKSDIFWHNSDTGKNSVWLINGTNVTSTSDVQLALDKEWDPTIVDFNADGKADIFWHNTSTGENSISLNSVNDFSAPVALPTLTGTGWDYKIADFDGDGKADIFSRNSQTGESNIWLMNGSIITNQQTSLPTNVPAAWNAQIGDFNGDGKTDIFWRNSQTGENAIWLMDGTTYIAAEFLPPNVPLDWTASIADFDKDGKTDIFWRNSQTGQDAVWLIDGTKYTAADFLYTVPTSWSSV